MNKTETGTGSRPEMNIKKQSRNRAVTPTFSSRNQNNIRAKARANHQASQTMSDIHFYGLNGKTTTFTDLASSPRSS